MLVKDGDLRDSYAQQDAYAQLLQLETDKDAIRAEPTDFLRANYEAKMEAIDAIEELAERREAFKELRKAVTNSLEDKAKRLTAEMVVRYQAIMRLTTNMATHSRIQPLLRKGPLQICDPHKVVNAVINPAIDEMLPLLKPFSKCGLTHVAHDYPEVDTIEDFVEVERKLWGLLGYLTALAEHRKHGDEDDLEPSIEDPYDVFAGEDHVTRALRTLPPSLDARYQMFMNELAHDYRLNPDDMPEYEGQELINKVDRWWRNPNRNKVTVNYVNIAGMATGAAAGAGAGAGAAAGAAAGAGGAANGAAAGARAGVGAGAVAINQQGRGQRGQRVDNRPLRSDQPVGPRTRNPPCHHCGRGETGPFHTHEQCMSNPVNMIGGVIQQVVHRCMKCGGPSLGHRPCPATAAQKTAFEQTDEGQRCIYWMTHKVRVQRKMCDTPDTHTVALHATSSGAAIILEPILDGGTNRTMVGEDVILEDVQPATGIAEGIGGIGLPIIGEGFFKLTPEVTIPALQVEGLKRGIISETEMLNSGNDVAIVVAAAPRGQHTKSVTKNGRVLFTAREHGGLFEVQRQAHVAAPHAPDATRMGSQGGGAGSATGMDTKMAAVNITQSYYEKHRAFYDMHRRLNHLSRPRMQHLTRTKAMTGLPTGPTLTWPSEDWSCLTCQQSKMRVAGHPAQVPAHRTATHRSSDLYIDIIELPNGKKGLHVRDKWGGYSTVDIADKKSAAAEFVQQRVHQRHTRDKALGGVVRVHSDIDVSMLTKETRAYFKAEHIELVPYSAHDPEAHGFVERPHADMWSGTRCSLADYQAANKTTLPMELYHWALQHAVHSINCVPRGDETQSPYELEHDRQPDYAERWTFGEPCVIKVLPKPTDKSAARGVQAQHFGMVEGSSTLHKALLRYKTKGGKEVVRVVITRSCARIFDDDVRLAGSPELLTEEECSLEALDAMTYNLWNGKNATECKVCKQPGQLLLCSFCPNSMHLGCVGLSEVPDEDYRCGECWDALGVAPTLQPNMDARDDGTDQQCTRSVNCPKPDKHIARCARRPASNREDTTTPTTTTTTTSTTAARTTAAAAQNNASATAPQNNATTTTEQMSATTTEEGAPVPPSTRRMYIAELQQKHTAKQMQQKDIAYFETAMTHVERRTMVRNSELQWRRTPEAQAMRLNKAERREIHQLHAELKAARNAGARGQRTSTDRLRRQVEKLVSMPVSRTTRTSALATAASAEDATTAAEVNHVLQRTSEDGIKEERHTIPSDFMQRIGHMRVPVGGVGPEDGVWVNHVKASVETPTPHARDIPKPKNHNEAKMSAQWSSWQLAEQAEIKQLQDRGVFSVVDGKEAEGNIVLGMTWSYKVKDMFDIDTDIWTGIQYKARLNIRGDQQKEEHINPDHRSSPTADMDSIRLLFATFAGMPGVEFLKFDVVAAFLNAKLDPKAPPIYMRAPQGMQLESGKMLRLNTNIYGLVEAAYLWFMEISTTLQQQGWVQGIHDPCIFNYPSTTEPSRLVLHVDDGMIGGINVAARYDALAEAYEMKNLGTRPTQFLGMELFHTKEGHVLLHNQQYIEHLMEYWAKHPEHPMDVRMARETKRVPLNPKTKLDDPLAEELPDAKWYHEFVGQITNLTKTRGDIIVASTQLSEGLQRQTAAHHEACRDLLLYLRDTSDLGQLYGQQHHEEPRVEAYADSEFGGNRRTGRAIGGNVIKVKGGLVSRKGKHQHAVTRSTNESETISFTDTAAAAIKVQNYLKDMGMEPDMAPMIHVDNANVVRSCRNVALATAARHYLQSHHWGRQQYREGRIKVQQVTSEDNMADINTKPLARGKFEKHRDAMGMVSRKTLQ